jgi:hypothetical protein
MDIGLLSDYTRNIPKMAVILKNELLWFSSTVFCAKIAIFWLQVMTAIQKGIDRANACAVSNAARVQRWTILPVRKRFETVQDWGAAVAQRYSDVKNRQK